MNKKICARTFFIFTLLCLTSLFLTGCSNTASQENVLAGNVVASTYQGKINIDKLEIIHFHGTNQCYSCVAVGDLAEETVNTYFKNELEKGIIVFSHLNGELPQNSDAVIKYGATGSSLWLGTYKKDGSFTHEQNVIVWYKINDKQDYMTYLKGVIEQKLAGN